MRVELDKNGAWADLLDVSDLRDGDRKRVNRAIKMSVDEDNRPILPGSLEDDMRDALLNRIVTNWSLGAIPADDPGALDRLTIEQADALAEAVKPHMALVRGKDDPTKRGTDPTGGSGS